MPTKAHPLVLAYDLGGTKLAAALVTHTGKILAERRERSQTQEGPKSLIRQMTLMADSLWAEVADSRARTQCVGLASAGPLDPKRGLLLDPTNFSASPQQARLWKSVPLARDLSRALKKPVVMENDAAAAMLAEKWKGAAQRYENAMILTLGTGLGTGILTNGTLVRAGRGLHPEAGHFILNSDDKTALCGCGNLGCAEAYLSGRSFERRYHGGKPKHLASETRLTPKEIARLARTGNSRAKKAFSEYGEWLAVAIHNYVVAYAPEVVILTGSFADASSLFLPSCYKKLRVLLARRRDGIDLLPKIKVSPLKNKAGVLGGATIAWRLLRDKR